MLAQRVIDMRFLYTFHEIFYQKNKGYSSFKLHKIGFYILSTILKITFCDFEAISLTTLI